jgi:hypothetical protein
MTDFAIALLTDQQPPQGQPTFLSSGGNVAFSSGLSFRVSAGLAYFNYVAKAFSATNVTLGAAHATLNRFDAIIVDSTGTVSVVAGTAAANPSFPDLDPLTQLALTYIRVDATVTQLSITTIDVYKENVEWTSSVSAGGRVSATSATTPFAGTKCVRFNAAISGDYAQFVNASLISMANAKQVILQLANESGAWPGPKSVLVTFFAGSTKVGQSAAILNGAYNFSTASTAFQQIAISAAAFAIPSATTIDTIQVKVNGGGSAITFRVDNIVIEYNSSVTSSGTNGVTDAQVQAAIASANIRPWITLTDGATITWDVSNVAEAKAKVTLGGSRILSIVGATNGQRGVIRVTQDGTGSRGLTLPTGSIQVGGGGTTAGLSTTASAVDLLAWEYDGTNYIWTIGKAAA